MDDRWSVDSVECCQRISTVKYVDVVYISPRVSRREPKRI